MTSLSVLVAKQLNKCEGKPASNDKSINNEALILAKDLFFQQVHPYFTEMFGDYWLSKFNGSELKCDFSKVWIHTLIGLNQEDIARGIAHHTLNDNAQYPPTPLRLRQLAVTTRETHDLVNLEILNIDMTR